MPFARHLSERQSSDLPPRVRRAFNRLLDIPFTRVEIDASEDLFNEPLYVWADTPASESATVHVYSFGTQPPVYKMSRSPGNHQAKTTIQSGDKLGEVQWFGYDGTSDSEVATISVESTQNYTGSAHGSKMVFSCVADGSTTVTDLLEINGGGGITLPSGHLTVSDGGTVTQLTSITTGVTLNTETGLITTVSSTLAAGAEAAFTVTNSKVGANDYVGAHLASTSSAGTPVVFVTAVAAGSFDVTISNLHMVTSLNNTLSIRFMVFGGSNT